MIAELSREESERLLSEQSIARLGCVLKDGEPYVVPVNYLFKDGAIFIHSLPGLKVEALRANPKACVQVDRVESIFKWRSAIAFGEFEEITGAEERDEFFTEFATQFQKLTPVEAIKHQTGEGTEIVLFRIRISRVTGLAEN